MVVKVLGRQIKNARLRRNRAMDSVANSAGISRTTLWKIEQGDPGVAIGHYVRVLQTLGLEEDMILVARDEQLAKLMEFQGLEIKRGYE